MRRSVALAFAAGVIVVIVAAPAMAQRDPFQPVIDTSGTTTTTGEAPATVGEGEVPLPAQSETLANTGADTQAWFVAAYALISVGAAAVVLSRMLAPVPARTAKTRS